MSGQTPVRLPLSARQAAALRHLLDPDIDPPTPDQVAALREVLAKLTALESIKKWEPSL